MDRCIFFVHLAGVCRSPAIPFIPFAHAEGTKNLLNSCPLEKKPREPNPCLKCVHPPSGGLLTGFFFGSDPSAKTGRKRLLMMKEAKQRPSGFYTHLWEEAVPDLGVGCDPPPPGTALPCWPFWISPPLHHSGSRNVLSRSVWAEPRIVAIWTLWNIWAHGESPHRAIGLFPALGPLPHRRV